MDGQLYIHNTVLEEGGLQGMENGPQDGWVKTTMKVYCAAESGEGKADPRKKCASTQLGGFPSLCYQLASGETMPVLSIFMSFQSTHLCIFFKTFIREAPQLAKQHSV